MKKLNRRLFIKRTSTIGLVTVISSLIPKKIFSSILSGDIDISIVKGSEYFNNTIKAIELLGGIEKFVSNSSKVGVVINSPWSKPGTFTNPDIAIAVLKLCKDAGARQIYCLENASEEYWKRSSLFDEYSNLLSELKNTTSRKTKIISEGIYLKEADVSSELDECDVFINIPIIKNHGGCTITGNLKNMMGLCPHSTNRKLHDPIESYSGNKNDYLSQCIADLNLIRKPDLCVADVTESIITNGPAGPGEIVKPQKIIAGTNPVSVDTCGALAIGFETKKIKMLEFAKNHGLGETDLTKLTIKEI